MTEVEPAPELVHLLKLRSARRSFFSSLLLPLIINFVVLSAYSESPHHAKPPDFLDPIGVTVCPNSSSAQLGILAPVLPQNEVFRTTLPQNEVFRILLPQNEGFGFVLTPSGMFKTVLPQNEVLKFVLPHSEVNRTVL